MAVSANRLELLQIADAVAREKSIDRMVVIEAMQDAMEKAAKGRYGAETEIKVEINPRSGETRMWRLLEIVEEVEERADGTLYVKANIVTSEERHKGIIVGKGGRGIREVGQSARKDLENITQKKVYLDLNVEVDEHWVERI